MKKYVVLFVVLISLQLNAQVFSLEECKSKALEHNQEIAMSAQQVKVAEELKKSAFTQFLPRVSANAAYIHTTKDLQLLSEDVLLPVIPYTALDAEGHFSAAALADPSVAASTLAINPATGAPLTDASGNAIFQQYTLLPAEEASFGERNIGILNAGVTQPIYMGGKIRETYKMAKTGQELAGNNLELDKDKILYEVEETYWTVVSLKEKGEMIDTYYEMLDKLVEDLENIHEEGIITRNDVLKARVKRNEVLLNKTKVENGLELTKMLLCQKTGIEYTESFDVSDSMEMRNYIPKTEDHRNQALNSRNELKILDNNIQLAESGVNLMRSRFLPNIALNAGYTAMNPNPYGGLAEEFGGDFMVGVVCNIPIYHFGDRRHTIKAARYEKEVACMKMEETKELISLQVQQAVYAFTESMQKVELAGESLGQAEENLGYVKSNFDEGMATTRDVLEAQASWHKAYSDLIDAKTEQQLRYCELQKITGEI